MADQPTKKNRMRCWRGLQKGLRETCHKAFTLPEVIVSFSVLVLVIVAATNVLTLVIRTNSDNVDNMLANGLAQEGLETIRFIRDSDAVLGLQFDGSVKNKPASTVWGAKLFDETSPGDKKFILVGKTPTTTGCKTTDLDSCLPVGLEEVSGDVADLTKSAETQVYLADDTATVNFPYLQSSSVPANSKPTQFHRLIVIEPLNDKDYGTDVNVMRVNSMVTWEGINGVEKKVVLTSDLTDWK